jgi:peptidoglycan/LPS O-acetylase OafA/YrhL
VYHGPLFIALQRFAVEGDAWGQAWTTAAAAVASFAVAEISYRTIEAWARRWSARFRAERGGFPSLVPPAEPGTPIRS